MADARDVDLLLLSPLKGELEPALRRLGAPVQGIEAPAPACVREYRVGGKRVWAGWTGMGVAATRATIAALGPWARAILHVGCAGALDPQLRTGQVVALAVALEASGASLDLPPGAAFDLLAVTVPEDHVMGVSMMLDRIVEDVAAKAALHAEWGAHTVEMETYAAVEAAAAAGAPIAAARVVIDTAHESLPDLSAGLDAVGDPRPFAMARVLASRPGAIPHLPRLARSFGAAQASIAGLVARVVDTLAQS